MKIVIIGATTGIGRSVAELYAAQGHEMVITGRRTTLLEEIQKAFQPQGMDPANSTPEEFGKLVEKDATRWADLIKAQNIKGE